MRSGGMTRNTVSDLCGNVRKSKSEVADVASFRRSSLMNRVASASVRRIEGMSRESPDDINGPMFSAISPP